MPFRYCLLLPFFICFAASAQTPQETEFFEKHVRPVFASKCAGCHNAKAKMGGLDLTSGEAFHKADATASLISKENPKESRLLRILGWEDTLKMPPTGKLDAEDLHAISEWVKAGVRGPAPAQPKLDSKPQTSFEERKKFWAFQPVKPQSPPAVKDTKWAHSPIDRFILAKLEEKGIPHGKPADKMTLAPARHIRFDGTSANRAGDQGFYRGYFA